MNNKGVTLIELLIVIVVIGIIATFAVPAVGDIISNSNEEAVAQDARTLADQARLYCGQGLCSAAQEGSTGITWADIVGFGKPDVFDGSKYAETDADTDAIVILLKEDGVWKVQLTASATGDYGFGGDATTSDFEDPVAEGKDAVYED